MGGAILLLAILILTVFMYNRVGREGFNTNIVILPYEIKPVERSSITKQFCSNAKFKNTKDKCMEKYIKENPGFFAVDKIITKPDLLNICSKYNPIITDETICINKYKSNNKYTKSGKFENQIYFNFK